MLKRTGKYNKKLTSSGKQPQAWRYVMERDVTASYGLAVDEFLMENINEAEGGFPAVLRLYNYKDHTALVGRFQNIRAEVNIENCVKKGYGYSRRLTGGGAIMMGSDQLGICLAASPRAFRWNHVRELYHLFSQPVVNTLQEMGIDAHFRSKNDIEVQGRKIAGLGVYISPRGAIQFHTSLLIDLDIPRMLDMLQIPIQKYSDKQKVKSVGERMTSINRELGTKISQQTIRDKISSGFAAHFNMNLEKEEITPEERKKIRELEDSRYNSEEWIYQNSPQPDMNGMGLKKTPLGMLRTYVGLKGETIKSVLITGDFMDQQEAFGAIESKLKWSHLDKDHIKKIVNAEFSKRGGADVDLLKHNVVESIWRASQRALAADRYSYNGSCYYPKNSKKESFETINQ